MLHFRLCTLCWLPGHRQRNDLHSQLSCKCFDILLHESCARPLFIMIYMLLSFRYAGTSLGTVGSMLMAGFLAGNYGWESVFYVMGLASALWLFLWAWLIQDTPSKQPLISQEERNYINTSLGSSDKAEQDEVKPPVPWRRVLTSMPFLAILVAHTCSNWGWYTLLIETSFYFKQVLHFNIKENAVVSAIPFLTMWFFSMALSKGLDALRARGKISTTFARKLSTLIASFIPMICLLILCYIGCHRTAAVFVMGLGQLILYAIYKPHSNHSRK